MSSHLLANIFRRTGWAVRPARMPTGFWPMRLGALFEPLFATLTLPADSPASRRTGSPDSATDLGADTDAEAAARRTARLVFAAKHPLRGKGMPLVLAGALALLVGTGATFYFGIGLPLLQEPAGVPRGPLVAATATTQLAPKAVQPTIAPLAPTLPAAYPASHNLFPVRSFPPTTGSQPPAAAAAVPEPTQIRIARTAVLPDETLIQAFDSLASGRLDAAEARYAHVLKSEPNNPDALHGMAAVALRRGQDDLAEQCYLRAREADPKDAVALAGLAGLRSHSDPLGAESQLKTLIAAQPGQHALHFALGNLYAIAGRWSEAQQAFFNAHTGDPEHPDYLFNLAVSLDRLRQPKLAVRFYQQALEAAGHRLAGFDQALASSRLQELQQ